MDDHTLPVTKNKMKNMSKHDKKLLKKQHRSIGTLLKHSATQPSTTPTKFLYVGNAGLGNGIQREQVFNLFSKYGQISDISTPVGKPYAFVSYTLVESAKDAMENLNGAVIACEESQAPNCSSGVNIYIAYVEPGSDVNSKNLKSELPEGLIILEEFVSEEEEQSLLAAIDWNDRTPDSAIGSLKHRKVKHYGYEFLYGINNVDLNCPLKDGIPSQCEQVLDRLIQGKYITSYPDQLTVNQYAPGQGIPPHIDTHSAFEDGLVSISLGCQVVMEFRHPSGNISPVLLPRRSAMVMTKESRYVWSHGITPRKFDIVPCSSNDPANSGLTLSKRETRTSLTFRKCLVGPCQCNYQAQCDSPRDTVNSLLDVKNEEADVLEEEHVHKVYEEIAGHFSATRHTPWPKVKSFVEDIAPGSILADIGCGNGKYLGINNSIGQFGCDRSSNLAGICLERGHQAFVCDALKVAMRDNSVDAAISIAVIHHFSTQARRVKAIEELARILQPKGRALVSVWAVEQKLHKKKSNYLKEIKQTNIQCEDSVNRQIDLKCGNQSQDKQMDDSQNDTDQVVKGQDDHNQGVKGQYDPNQGVQCQDGLTRGIMQQKNCINGENKDVSISTATGEKPYANVQSKSERTEKGESLSRIELKTHVNRTEFKSQDMFVPWHLKNKTREKKDNPVCSNEKVYHRYYHVFKQGELEELCRSVPSIAVKESYYDQGNWCVIFEKE
ncbi:unnamed protein product [Owenia fusiformis]|uniref:tRNA (carboxymethyluridine(34)-5-O)-methyltransferase n=1 Tax=Owenia fusiformis TaxID=6347 RepID=A0A8J1XJI2_OWEFU|nr:unnamed protein product [Owenia fusiformis]